MNLTFYLRFKFTKKTFEFVSTRIKKKIIIIIFAALILYYQIDRFSNNGKEWKSRTERYNLNRKWIVNSGILCPIKLYPLKL